MPGATSIPLPALLRVLGDPTRLRILGLLELEELSVGELGRSLEMAQSRVSNHLRVLREQGLLAERHVGTSTFVRAALGAGTASGASGGEPGFAERLWATLREGLAELDEHAADRHRLGQVLAARESDGPAFFDRVAGEWDKLGACFSTGQARERAVASLVPPGQVLADLGCGTGYVARALFGIAAKVICVDRSPGMLEEARKRLAPLPSGTEVELREGRLDALPLADGEVDGAIAGMVLHHLESLDAALAEMRRVIRPGGTAVVLELAPHNESWMHAELGDRHLGLEPAHVTAALRRAGFEDCRLEPVLDRYSPRPPDAGEPVSLSLYIVRGRVPAGARDPAR